MIRLFYLLFIFFAKPSIHKNTHTHTHTPTYTSRLDPATPLQTQWGVLVRFKACIVPDQPTCLAHSPVTLLAPLHLENYRKMGQERKKGEEADAGEMEEEKKKGG